MKLGRASVAVVKANQKKTCTLERERVTLLADLVYTPKTGGNVPRAKLSVIVHMP
jgi:hypothetical protein